VLTPLVLALVCLLPGLPLAVLLARRRPGGTPFSLTLVEGMLLGLCWYLAVGVVLANRHELGLGRILVPTLVLDAVVLAVLLAGPSRWWRGVVSNPVMGAFGSFVALAFVVGAALRTRPAYFIYDIGDFGEYVNRGNVLADGGPFTQWFTQGFSILLALSHVLLGEAREVDVMGFLGLLVMAVALAIAARIGAGKLGLGVLAVVFAIGVVPVWFSNFPASETAYAVLALGLVLFLVAAVQAGHVGTGIVGGLVFGFFLMLMRGNAVLLFPVLLAVAVVVAPFVGRSSFRVVVGSTAAAMAGLYAGFVYDARYNHPYFIDFQMPQFLPDGVWHRFADVGEVGPALWKGAVFAVLVALVLVVATALNRWLGPPAEARWLRAAVLPAALVVGLLALVAPLDAGGLREGLGHYDGAVQALVVVGLLGAFIAFAGRLEDHVRVGVVCLVLVAEAFALLHAYRFDAPRYASYFLYWDRYLWSDFFPAAMILAALGIGVVQVGWRRLGLDRRLTAAVVVVVAMAGFASLWSAGTVARQHRFLGDAYGTLHQVDELTDDLPIVYAGILPEDMPGANLPKDLGVMGHPNTFRMFAQPLTETFGRTVYGIGHIPPTGGDPRPTLAQVAQGMREEGLTKVAYVEVTSPNRLGSLVEAGDPELDVRTTGTVRIDIPMLDRPRWRQPKHWRVARFRLTVHELTLR
jgi:hypothetical protein